MAHKGQDAVVAEADDIFVDNAYQTAIIDAVVKTVNETYIFPEVAKDVEMSIRGKLRDGAYDTYTKLGAFTRALTDDLGAVSNDKHLAVWPEMPTQDVELDTPSPEEQQARYLEEMRAKNYRFYKLEILPGNVGYLELREFADPAIGGATAVAALNFLAHVDALIIDLRDNGGGDGYMAQFIASYFFDEPVHFSSVYVRPDNTTEQLWTYAHVPGPRLSDTPLYLLTSKSTFSAAEDFAYSLKARERATIVGERTRGGAHPIDYRFFKELRVQMMVPIARSINPVTGTNWEGTGVEPDFDVPADTAFPVARQEALTRLLQDACDEQRRYRLRWALESLQAEEAPVLLDAETLKSYVGTYEAITIGIKDGALSFQRGGRRVYRMVPMGDDLFRVRHDEVRVQFTREESGVITGLVRMLDDGRTTRCTRTGD